MSIAPAVAAIGFTGTRYGMTVAQRRILRLLLANGAGREFHHGDCVGAGGRSRGEGCAGTMKGEERTSTI